MNKGRYALPSVALTPPIVYENNAFKYERETRERYFHHNLTIEKRNIE